MENLLGLCVGIGLSAACGFRVFVPLFAMSIAAYSGHLELSQGFSWIGTEASLIAFGVATVLEVTAYYVPWLDNLLDTITTPAAVVAGTIVTASMVADMSPFLKWTLAVIAGGGAAGLVQGATVATRALSTGGTGGLANPILSTAELGGSIFGSAVAIMAPVLGVVLLLGLALLLVGVVIPRYRARKSAAAATAVQPPMAPTT